MDKEWTIGKHCWIRGIGSFELVLRTFYSDVARAYNDQKVSIVVKKKTLVYILLVQTYLL